MSRELTITPQGRLVVRDAAENRFNHIVVFSEVIPTSTDWKEYTRSRERK